MAARPNAYPSLPLLVRTDWVRGRRAAGAGRGAPRQHQVRGHQEHRPSPRPGSGQLGAGAWLGACGARQRPW